MMITDTEFVDTVVIGGGQAGLAMGNELARNGRDFVILDAAPRIGEAWRSRWDSLLLNTPARFDGLPGMPFPGDQYAYPTKDEVASYLEEYATTRRLPVRSGVRVESLRREGGRFVASAGPRRWESQNVVVATGGCQAPKVPAFAGQLGADVVQRHSSEYRSPEQLPDGPVLVVGVGNSGAEIARELAPTRETMISGTPSAELPVRPTRRNARFLFPVFRFVGLHVLTMRNPVGRRAAATFHAAPLVRTKVADLVAAGVRVVPRVTGVRGGRPAFADGTTCEVSSVVWCTGFRNDFGWIDLPAFDAAGEPVHHRGVAASVPGLYFVGLEFLYALASATLPGIGRDARHIARRMPAPAVVRPGEGARRVGVMVSGADS